MAAQDHQLGIGGLLVRTASSDPAITVDIQRTLRRMPQLWSTSVEPFMRKREEDLSSRKFFALVFTSMATMGLLLAALGIYGLLDYSVSRRRREFAIRLTLGASPRDISRTVLHDCAVMLLGGLALGTIVTFWSGQYVDTLLTAAVPVDAAVLLLCDLIVLVAGFGAAVAPARRACQSTASAVLSGR